MDKLEQIIVAALLHDIGKFSQRAGVKHKFIEDENKKSLVCRFNKKGGYFTHLHSLYTLAFFDDYEKHLPKVEIPFENNENNITNFASFHHNPSTDIGWIIAEADRLSSGMDRPQGDLTKGNYRDFKKRRLKSIFQKIYFGEKVIHDEYVYPLMAMTYGDELIPFSQETEADLEKEYLLLWKDFIKELSYIDSTFYIAKLKQVLQKYTWCIPSYTNKDFPDISLYDHSITTAAIASALFTFHSQEGTLNEAAIKNRSIDKFALISGDLSGIQNYIYNLYGTDASGTSKILRARSCYIELLNDLSARYIIDELNLNSINILFCSGGKFIILAPLFSDFIKKLNNLYFSLSSWYKDYFNGELSLNLSYEFLNGEDFSINQFSKKFRSLSQKIQQKKLNKFSEILLQKPQPENFIIEEDYKEYKNGSCSFCGKKPVQGDREDGNLCKSCNQLKKFGEVIPNIKVFAIAGKKVNIKSMAGPLSFFNDRYLVYLFSSENINEKKFLDAYSLNSESKLPYRIMANYVPSDQGKNLTFEEISKKSCSQKPLFLASNYPDKTYIIGNEGQSMLGVLRADVDSMGLIFGYGLEEDDLEKSELTISRYSTISRMFDIFFSAYLQNIIKESQNFRYLYTVYAGGDDLFLVGPWDSIIDFSLYMRDKFNQFVSGNKNITLSSAVGLFKPNYPIKRFADATGRLLDEAKNGNSKNTHVRHGDRINIFGKSLDWKMANDLLGYGVFLDQETKKEKLGQSTVTMSFLYRLFSYYLMYEKYNKEREITYLRFNPLFYYDLGRNIIKTAKHNNKSKIINQEVVSSLSSLFEDFKEHLPVPLSWAIYNNRTK